MTAAKCQIPSASRGATLRAERAAGLALGIEAEKFTGQRQLCPDKMVCSVVSALLDEHPTGFLFDRLQGSSGRAVRLGRMLNEVNSRVDVVLSFDAKHETIERRVLNRLVCSACRNNFGIGLHVGSPSDACPKCGSLLIRCGDDSLEAGPAGMVEYVEKTESPIAPHANQCPMRAVDSMRPPEVVFSAVSHVLGGQ